MIAVVTVGQRNAVTVGVEIVGGDAQFVGLEDRYALVRPVAEDEIRTAEGHEITAAAAHRAVGIVLAGKQRVDEITHVILVEDGLHLVGEERTRICDPAMRVRIDVDLDRIGMQFGKGFCDQRRGDAGIHDRHEMHAGCRSGECRLDRGNVALVVDRGLEDHLVGDAGLFGKCRNRCEIRDGDLVEIDHRLALDGGEQFLDGRDLLVGDDVRTLDLQVIGAQLLQRQVGNVAAAGRGAVDRAVMHQHVMAVLGAHQIGFENIDAEADRAFDGRQRVLGEDAGVVFPIAHTVGGDQRIAVLGVFVGGDDRIDRGADIMRIDRIVHVLQTIRNDMQSGIFQLARREVAGLDDPALAIRHRLVGNDIVDIGAVEAFRGDKKRAVLRRLAVDVKLIFADTDLVDRVIAVRDGGGAVAQNTAESGIGITLRDEGEAVFVAGIGITIGNVVMYVDDPTAAIGERAGSAVLGAVFGAGDQENTIGEAVHAIDLDRVGSVVVALGVDAARPLAGRGNLVAVIADPGADITFEVEIRDRDIGVVFVAERVVDGNEDRIVAADADRGRTILDAVVKSPVDAVLGDRGDENAAGEIVRRTASAHMIVAAIGIADAAMVEREEFRMAFERDEDVIVLIGAADLVGGDIAGVNLALVERHEGEIERATVDG